MQTTTPLLPSAFWSDLSSLQLAQLVASPIKNQLVAVLPVAATEQHGPHLPLSVDTLILEGIIQAALGLMGWQAPPVSSSNTIVPALFLPTQKISLSTEHQNFTGTLTLSPQVVLSLWLEIGACVAHAGIKKLVIFNSHGGNNALMDIVARELRAKHDLITYHSSWFNLPLIDPVTGANLHTQFSEHEHRFGVHAGEIETSILLTLRPDLVDLSQAKIFPSKAANRAIVNPLLGNGKSAKLGWMIEDHNQEGAVGNAAAATAERGSQLIRAAAHGLASLLQEVSELSL